MKLLEKIVQHSVYFEKQREDYFLIKKKKRPASELKSICFLVIHRGAFNSNRRILEQIGHLRYLRIFVLELEVTTKTENL